MKEKEYVVIGFGDSITLGAKATKEEYTWLGIVETQLRHFIRKPIRVLNKGVGDNTISPRTTNYEESTKPSALERVHTDVIALQPHLVFVCFGLNDMRFGTPVEIFQEDLEKVVMEIKSGLPTAEIILTNVFHMTGWKRYQPRDRGSIALTRAYNEAIVVIGKKQQVPVSDVSAAMAFKDFLIHEDGVHGNDLGHRIIGNRVFETLVQKTSIQKKLLELY